MEDLKQERLYILELLKMGKIDSDEASKLLDALSHKEEKNEVKNKNMAFRMLRIKIDSVDGEKVRVNIPLEFAGLLKNKRFGSFDLNEFDIDMDMLVQMIKSGATGNLVDIEDADGTKITISIE